MGGLDLLSVTNNGFEGRVLGNRYRIIRHLGRGGMADVYLGTDLVENIDVAIKILKLENSHDAEFLRRFESEARAVASLSHPNIVQVYGIGEDEGIHYMVMEYIQGITLKELLQQCVRLDWDTAVPIAIQIGLALEHAHSKGIIHRDIKPQNIMITPDVKAKVTDFGIARASSANTITMTGAGALGSVHYFSPEQARGGMVGEKSDIYSLGIMLYELVTGDLPFDGDTSVSIAIKHLQESPAAPSTHQPLIPAGLDGIIMKCIQKSADKRYANAAELVADLDALMIDPEGEYGLLDHTDEMAGTQKIGPIRQDPDYRKIGQIESTLNERRKSRRRDMVMIAVLVVVAAIALVNIGVIAWKRLVEKIPTKTTAGFTVGDYYDREIEGLETELSAKGMVKGSDYQVEYVTDDTVAVGRVIRQAPVPGTVIGPDSYTVLTLTVSGGPDLIKLEDYTGQSYLVIQPRLETTLGLKVEIVREMNQTFGKDLIIRMEPAPGSQVAKGSTVRVIVSDGTGRVKLTADLRGLGKTQLEARLAAMDLVAGAYEVTPFASAAIAAGTVQAADLISLSFNYPVDTDVPVKTSITTIFGTREELEGILNPTPTPDPNATTLPSETTAPTEPTAEPTKPTKPPKETTTAPTVPTSAIPTATTTAAPTTPTATTDDD